MAHMKRMQGGYHVPDSDDDAAADDEEDGEGGEDGGRDENVPRSQGAGASRVANSVAGVAEPAAMADITQHVAEEMDVWNLPAQQHAPSLNRKSRSAKAGAVLDQQEQQPQEPRHVVPHRRSASPGPVGQRPSPRARRSPPAVRDAVQKPQPPTKAPFRPAGPNNTRKISSGTTARFKVFLARQKAERAAEKAAAQKKTDDLLRRRGGT